MKRESVLALLFTFLLPSTVAAADANMNVNSVCSESTRCQQRQSTDDAWWTGPMLTPSANTLPRGHFLLEPYLFNVRGQNSSSIGSLTYVLYGLTNKLTVGFIPTAAYNFVSRQASSSGVGIGDVSVQAQYRLMQFQPGSWKPTLSVNVQETLPTGKYDHLGNRSANGQGSGTRTTTLGLYTQQYFWLPNGRIFRVRINVSRAFASSAVVDGNSVYGTGAGFHGTVSRSRSPFVNLSGEYSVTRKWVIALDAVYRHDAVLTLSGATTDERGFSTLSTRTLPSRDSVGFAPAVEYSWRSTIGVLLGARVLGVGHNSAPSVTPAVAINFVH
jgi:hypothetical protein